MKKIVFIICMFMSLPACADNNGWQGEVGIQTIKTVDANTTCYYPTVMKVSNSTLTCNSDGSATLLTGGGGGGSITGASSVTVSNSVAYLVGDLANPGLSFLYGTNSSGVKGWFAQSSGNVTTVSNSDNTLSISPTSGPVVASINLGNPNTWSGVQSFSPTDSSSSGTATYMGLTANVNESGTAGFTGLKINAIENSTGSGSKLLQDWQVGGTSKAKVDDTGSFTGTSYVTVSTSGGELDVFQPTANGSNYIAIVAPTSLNATSTLTLTRPRVNTVASSATPAINTDTTDMFTITALATAVTSMSSSLTGTASNGQRLIIRILDNGTARTITWGASFASRGVALPTTTVISKYLYIGLIYNSTTSTWDCVAVSLEQ